MSDIEFSSLTQNLDLNNLPTQSFKIITRTPPNPQCVECYNTACRRPTQPKENCPNRV